MPALIQDVEWENVRSTPLHGRRRTVYRRAYVTLSDYLAVKQEDGAWRWDIYTTREHDALGRCKRLDGGSRSTLRDAKQAAVDAWLKR